jgi:hypothetical protein
MKESDWQEHAVLYCPAECTVLFALPMTSLGDLRYLRVKNESLLYKVFGPLQHNLNLVVFLFIKEKVGEKTAQHMYPQHQQVAAPIKAASSPKSALHIIVLAQPVTKFLCNRSANKS